MTALTRGIDWGTHVGTADPHAIGPNVITYWFGASLAGYESRFLAAFAIYASFLNVEFDPAPEASANFRLTGFSSSGSLLGMMEPPGETDAGHGEFNTIGYGWSLAGLVQGGYGFVTIIHELGHGMGLAHPHDNGGSSTIFPGVSGPYDTGAYGLNQGVYTTMSYNDGWQLDPDGLPPGIQYGYQGTPMAIDIAVLQAKYGANMNWHPGADSYALPGVNGSGTFFSCIWDAGGIDRIAYGGARPVTIDLRPATLQVGPGGGGFISYVHGIFGGFTIANGVKIENARSGYGNDTLIGNGAGNVLDAGGGADKLIGKGGDDWLIGRGGADILSGGPGNDVLNGGGAGDTFLFSDPLNGATNVDKLPNFAHGQDLIGLAHSVFGTLHAGWLPASEFFRGAAAHDLSDRVIYSPSTGALHYDSNGSRAGGSVLFADLPAHIALSAHDFLVV